MDVTNVLKAFDSLSMSELVRCKIKLEQIIQIKNQPSPTVTNIATLPSNFIDLHSNFVDKHSVQYTYIHSDLQSLNFKPSSDNAVTKWLTATGENYVWSSSKGKLTVKQPLNIAEYPGISDLMYCINRKFGTKLNSCLASNYKSGGSRTRYHADDESSLDSSQGIYVVSFGVDRILDLNKKGKDGRFTPDFSLTASDCSLYIMKPGCQDECVHRVRGDNSFKGERYSLSFRRSIPHKSQDNAQQISSSASTTVTPVAVGDTQQTSSSASTAVIPAAVGDTLSPNTGPSKAVKPKRRRTTVIFGTSITKHVQPGKLGFRGRKVVNISQPGAKIRDIISNVREFYENGEAAKNNDIEKIIFSLGTNDVKFSRSGVGHLKKHIVRLIDTTQDIFPAAIILFQCCLPIRCTYPYIARNVLDFNTILKDMCFLYNCVYVDCFRDFLVRDFTAENRELYHDWLHLNSRGIGVLSIWLKFLVNENSFDRVVNNLLGII